MKTKTWQQQAFTPSRSDFTFRHRTLEERTAGFGRKAEPYDEFGWDEPVAEKEVIQWECS